MHVALAVAFGLIAVAPFVGRWRANLWLKANAPQAPRLRNNVIEIA